MWPWGRIKDLQRRLDEANQAWSSSQNGNLHYQRVLESIDPDVVSVAQTKVCDWYFEQNRRMANSIWHV